ncbi:NAD-P-binding protein [Trametes meyenii]|nr:NAD-P-binding protein [Trametes meyenii]
MTTSYAVVGASRGIGLAYVLQLAERKDSIVFAVVRNKQRSTHLAEAIENLKNVYVIEGDVADHRSIARSANEISSITGGKLDYLIHNAAKMDMATMYQGPGDYTNLDELDKDFLDAFKINALGVLHSISAFLPLLRAGEAKKIIVMGSEGGHPAFVSKVKVSVMAAYGMTKAAGEMATLKWAMTLKDEGFTVVTMNPGVVDTSSTVVGSGSAEALAEIFASIGKVMSERGMPIEVQTPEQSVKAQLKVIDGLQPSDNGSFLSYTGQKTL